MSRNYEDFTINQGADLAIELHCTEPDGSVKDLTNHSINAFGKRNYTDSASDPNTFQFNGIISNASEGIATISLTNNQTDALNPRGRYVYDVELSFIDSDSNTIIERILEGQIEVSPSATK
jgi:hypothetical protein